jgi:hypothetical protein
MKYFNRLIAFAACILALAACKNGKNGKLLPNVSGKAGEILVVIDREQWEGNLGTAIRGVLADDCPYLAQREPLFTLSNVPTGTFNNMFKMHRNILIVNINPQNQSTGMVYHSNQWAQPQVVAQINAYDEEGALELFRENGALVSEYFEQAERDRIISNAKLYEESSLREPMEALTGGIVHFPSGYKLRKATDSFVWIADEKQYVQQYVMAYKYPVKQTSGLFTMENIIAARNQIMQENVPGMFDGSYMTTSTAIEPSMRYLRFHGREFVETRGFWEMHGDFMGGPFVSHSFYSPDGQYIIVLEAFVYAPKYDKRQYLRQVESLLYSFEWKKDGK